MSHSLKELWPEPEPRRLKRGLRDLSPLFGKPAPAPVEVPLPTTALPPEPSHPSLGLQCLSVYGADAEMDSPFLNQYLASRFSALGLSSVVVSLGASEFFRDEPPIRFRPHSLSFVDLKQVRLSWRQFEKLWTRESPPSNPQGDESMLLVDLDYSRTPYFEKIIPLLDKWIVLVKPTLASVSDAYKMIKATFSLNSHLEYFLVTGADPESGSGEILFERLSEMISRRLGADCVWLGHLRYEKGQILAESLALEHLLMPQGSGRDLPEKRAFFELLQAPLPKLLKRSYGT